MSNLYDIKNFTDAQLYSILDIDNPTDRELEARIIHLIRKYNNMQNEDGDRLSHFFKQVYDHFFDNNDENNNVVEGFNDNTEAILQIDPNSTSIQTDQIGYDASITSVKTFDYTKDKLQLNPLLKQTIKRVISIDSQYRNITTSPLTTNFSFDLSEPLRDVLSLKLYSIQIPYTWYIINKNYGANFFYLKARNNKIADGNHDLKISIPIGNYTAPELITTINNSFNTEITTYPNNDINFSDISFVSYNANNSKTTFNLNFQNTFNEAYYQIDFSYVTPSIGSDITRTTNIASYLGFNYTTYPLNSIQSDQTYSSTSFVNSENIQAVFTIDNSNNYFTVIQYQGPNTYTSTSTIFNSYIIQLELPTGQTYTRSTIINSINTSIQQNGNFTIDSKIEQVDISNTNVVNTGHSYFKLTMELDRYKVAYIPNTKLCIIFPNELPKVSTIDNRTRTIWTIDSSAYNSCFFFSNNINETSEIISEIPTIESTLKLSNNTNMRMRFLCNTTNYTDGSNNFTLPIVPLPTQTQYTIYEYRDLINNAFLVANTTYGSIFSTTPLSVDNNIFDMKINLNKTFNSRNCLFSIDSSNSLLVKYFGFSVGNINLQDISNITTQFIPQSSGYIIADFTSTYLFTLKTNRTNGNTMADIIVNLITSNTSYPTYIAFASDIQSSIKHILLNTTIGNNIIDTYPLFDSTFIITDTSGQSKIANTNINYSYSLSELNYTIFFDPSPSINDISNTYWSQFDISASYNLSLKTNDYYAKITGNITGSELLNVSENNIFTIYTNSNFPFIPNNIINIDISINTPYTITDIYQVINNQLTANPLTYGSSISSYRNPITNKNYSKFRICINDIYTANDYYLDFYNPINFSTCLPTSSSIQNTTWDSTVGWILGFRDYTQYYLKQENQTSVLIGTNTNNYYLTSSNGQYTIQSTLIPNTQYNNYIVSLTGDTTLNTFLYNYFLISLDDYIQNRLNDGLVTITRNQTALSVPSYSYSTTEVCDPATNTLISTSLPQTNSDNVTNHQIYSLNQTLQSNVNQIKTYSSGPFIKDLFGLIPIKPGTNGTYYIEFGGTLQNQERVYFGPVNIRKMTIQLLNDRGDIVDLNGSNWAFSFICEQLYRDNSS